MKPVKIKKKKTKSLESNIIIEKYLSDESKFNDNNIYLCLDSEIIHDDVMFRADIGCLITGEWMPSIDGALESLAKIILKIKEKKHEIQNS